ncbi:hypothetical protein Vafri_15822 [Volvox africanus]|uniref:Peptidase S1 domain-containing protein n=1 Tax=Volvox africanus TaxID=51714 RepID=A0A8J4BHM3_9CHLO|nr:hypothetical protein Vafri_15822 [Volvox africanus]
MGTEMRTRTRGVQGWEPVAGRRGASGCGGARAVPWVVIGLRSCAWLTALFLAHQYLMLLAMASSSTRLSFSPSSSSAAAAGAAANAGPHSPSPGMHGAFFPGFAPPTRLRDLAAWWGPRSVIPSTGASAAPSCGDGDIRQPEFLKHGSVSTDPRVGGSDDDQAPQARTRGRRLIQRGSEASISRHPYVAVVARSDGSYLCAGSLVHPRVVVTAGHCVSPSVGGTVNPLVYLGLERLKRTAAGGSGGGAVSSASGGAGGSGSRLVVAAAASGAILVNALAALVGLGSTGGLAGGPAIRSRSVPHPKYNPGIFDYDVALLILDKDAPSTSQPIRVAPTGGSLPRSAPMTVLGWGATEENSLSEDLRRGAVKQLDKATCQELFRPYGTAITARMMCTAGRTCAGDSGGPVIFNDNLGLYDKHDDDSDDEFIDINDEHEPDGGDTDSDGGSPGSDVLVGHVSFGFPRRKGQGCPQPNPATVFTDLRNADVNFWLRRKLAEIHQQMAEEDLTLSEDGKGTDGDHDDKDGKGQDQEPYQDGDADDDKSRSSKTTKMKAKTATTANGGVKKGLL